MNQCFSNWKIFLWDIFRRAFRISFPLYAFSHNFFESHIIFFNSQFFSLIFLWNFSMLKKNTIDDTDKLLQKIYIYIREWAIAFMPNVLHKRTTIHTRKNNRCWWMRMTQIHSCVGKNRRKFMKFIDKENRKRRKMAAREREFTYFSCTKNKVQIQGWKYRQQDQF